MTFDSNNFKGLSVSQDPQWQPPKRGAGEVGETR